MDKDRVKGTIDDAVGRAKRQAGEWTGDTQTQAEGAGQQVKGKVEKAWGNMKDAARNATKTNDAPGHVDRSRDDDRNTEEEKEHSSMGQKKGH